MKPLLFYTGFGVFCLILFYFIAHVRAPLALLTVANRCLKLSTIGFVYYINRRWRYLPPQTLMVASDITEHIQLGAAY